jgi:hypothetical protein
MKQLLVGSLFIVAASCSSVSTPSARLFFEGRELKSQRSFFASASTTLSDEEIGLKLIRRHLPVDCAFEIQATLGSGIGTNGHWHKLWRTSTCEGEVLFQFNYWPPDFFPNFPGPYEIRRFQRKPPPASGG